MLWVACAMAYGSGQAIGEQACKTFATYATLGVVPIAFIAFCFRKPAMACLIMSLALGAALGFATAFGNHQATRFLSDRTSITAKVVLEGDSKATTSGESAFATIVENEGKTTRVYADFGDTQPLLHGTAFMVSGTLEPANWERDEYLWQNGAVGRLRVVKCEAVPHDGVDGLLITARSRAIEVIGDEDDGCALLQAIVCGYRHSIANTALYAAFQSCGIAHLVAVSGAHLVIVTGLFAVFLKSARASRRVTVIVLVLVMGSYLVFSGAPISAIRATIMTSIGMFSIFAKRRPFTLNALGIGIYAIVITSPSSSVSVSFALSALSTAGIVLFSPLIGFWICALPVPRVPLIADTLSITFSANLLSQLFACSVFSVFPVLSPVANVACAPAFPVVCTLGLMSAILGITGLPISGALIHAASASASILGNIATAIASIPFSSIPFTVSTLAAVAITLFVASLLWLAWPALKTRYVATALCILLAAFMAFSVFVSRQDAIVMLDVGQGDSFLIRSRGQTLLIDTGNRDSQLIEQLAMCAVLKLDSVLVTHSDDDHAGSLDALDRAVHVDRVILAADLLSSKSEKNVQLIEQAHRTASDVVGVRAGDTFDIGCFSVRVLWPVGLSDDGGNADSVCLLLVYDGDDDGEADFKALFTGDAEEPQIRSIMESCEIGDIDVLKVGHHGSKGAMSESQLRALSPEVALIGVGEGNRYGHPSDETIGLLDSVGCTVYRSDLNGQVKCLFSGDAIRVRLQWSHGQR